MSKDLPLAEGGYLPADGSMAWVGEASAPLTDEQVAEFRERLAETMKNWRGVRVINCIMCSGPNLIHKPGCPLAPAVPGDA